MKFIKKNIKWITITVVIMIIIGLISLKHSLIKKNNSPKQEEISILEKTPTEPELEAEEPEIKNVYVDIKGAVALPGVYEIEENKKVIDVIELAGGFTEQADTSLVNLAKKVENEMVIIIYTSDEVRKATAENSIAKIVDKQCICPEIKNDACINNNTTESSPNKETNTQKINLNTATLEELQTLSGIGESKAKAIIEYRETNGFFQTIEELMEVSGIGEALYEKVKNNITV